MSQGCALLILRSKGQRSRSWRMVIWKWFPDDNWLCNQPMIMKLHTLTPHEFVGVGGGPVLLQQYFQYAFICCPYMLPLLFENGFRTITDSVINLWSWNFIHLLTMSQGCALLILRSKGQGHGAWLFENGFRTITDSVINLWSWNFIHLLTMSQGCALLILRSKGQRSRSWRMVIISPPPVKPEGTIGLHCLSVSLSVRHTSLSIGVGGGPVLLQQYFQYAFICCPYMLPLLFENGFRTITDSVINLWSWNFIHLLTMSQGCALLILRSKGQRSRSWRMVIWKWFPDDNWLCNQPMIMKLHTLTHHESRMRPIDFEVKRSKVKVMAHGYLKMVSGR